MIHTDLLNQAYQINLTSEGVSFLTSRKKSKFARVMFFERRFDYFSDGWQLQSLVGAFQCPQYHLLDSYYSHVCQYEILRVGISCYSFTDLTTSPCCFRKQNYTLFIVYHTVAGLLDSFDGTLARSLNQRSYVGQYLDSILDQYAHILIYASIGYLYSSYIVFFFVEIALDIWPNAFEMFMLTLSETTKSTWPNQASFLSEACSISVWEHPNLRLFRWYGSDIFHTLLIVRYILINEADQKFVIRLKRHVSMKRLQSYIRILLFVTGISSVLRTIIGSCFMIDKLQRLATLKVSM